MRVAFLVQRWSDRELMERYTVFISFLPAATRLSSLDLSHIDSRRIVLATFESRRAAFLSAIRCLPFSLHSRYVVSSSKERRKERECILTVSCLVETKIDRYLLSERGLGECETI